MSQEQEIINLLKELKETIQLADKEVLTAKEACDYMGISEMSLKRYVAAGYIRFSTPMGKTRYFDKSELNRFMRSNNVNTINI